MGKDDWLQFHADMEVSMTGALKYPVLDPDFRLKLLGACSNDYERGLISVLWLTGMHVCVISKGQRMPIKKGKVTVDHHFVEHETPKIIKEGALTYIYWRRAKTNTRLREAIPKDLIEPISAFLAMPRKSQRYNFDLVHAVGMRSGYTDISPNTLRHSRCLRGLTIEGYTIYEMTHKMGCTLDVVVRNYAALKDSQIDLIHQDPIKGGEPIDRNQDEEEVQGTGPQ